MYLRLLIIITFFNLPLAIRLALPLIALFVLATGCAWVVHVRSRPAQSESLQQTALRNPLELTTALVFASLFVVISVASSWMRIKYGAAGVYSLAALVGLTDIDPFALSLAQGSTVELPRSASAAAILIAASSNNLLKAGYAMAFAGWQKAVSCSVALVLLAVAGIAIALLSA
jgi:uncharacterized membrane protein (DUF4010 family)